MSDKDKLKATAKATVIQRLSMRQTSKYKSSNSASCEALFMHSLTCKSYISGSARSIFIVEANTGHSTL